jgi:hypothetical protein
MTEEKPKNNPLNSKEYDPIALDNFMLSPKMIWCDDR